ncbi:hypothetical protein R1flu_023880 [Riccia fluitans]|uniref:Uncharacterized protein n=1 Tax=Riccia fluitans TaxID=41844 RepID=A0ABD1XTA2_9MARC
MYPDCRNRLDSPPKSKIAAELLPQCQTLNKRYCVTPWLASPHVQTLFLHFFGRSPRVDYQRLRVRI